MRRGTVHNALAGLLLTVASPLTAAMTGDASGDFLATYAGPPNGDLDILGASVAFDGTSFLLSSTQNGVVGASAGSLFVWGINRGGGSARLALGSPSIGQDVLFDAVAVLIPDGLARVAAFPLSGPPVITPLQGTAVLNGNTISGVIPVSLLTSTGLMPNDYTFTLWSRRRVDPTVDGSNAEIADFAPALTAVTPAANVPESASWAMMVAGFGAIGAAMRRKHRVGVSFA